MPTVEVVQTKVEMVIPKDIVLMEVKEHKQFNKEVFHVITNFIPSKEARGR